MRETFKAPAVGEIATVFDYSNHAGTFDSVVADGMASGFLLTPIYNANTFQVRVASASVPESQTWAQLLAVLLVWAGTRKMRSTHS